MTQRDVRVISTAMKGSEEKEAWSEVIRNDFAEQALARSGNRPAG